MNEKKAIIIGAGPAGLMLKNCTLNPKNGIQITSIAV